MTNITSAPLQKTSFGPVTKTITFTGGANLGLAASTITVFTITGRVIVDRITAFCTASLTESGATATIGLGTTTFNNTILASLNAVDIDTNMWWMDASPNLGITRLNVSSTPDTISLKDIVLSENIVMVPAVTNVNGGTLIFSVWYTKITSDGALA
jgi:hypothetical protein